MWAVVTLLALVGCTGKPGETAGDTSDTSDTGESVSGDCVAGDALPAAIAGGDATVVVCPGTWSVNLVVARDLVLNAPETEDSPAAVTLDGGGLDAVVRIDAGTVTLRGLTITGGAGVEADDGEREGGGVYVAAGAAVTLDGVTLTGNTAHRGGGLRAQAGATVSVVGGEVSGNCATGSGGGLRVDGGVTLAGTAVTGNEAPIGGGIAVYPEAGATVTVAGDAASSVTKNGATWGGGLALGAPGGGEATVEVTGLTLQGNVAELAGGGIDLPPTDTGSLSLALTGVALVANHAQDGGGARLYASGTVPLSGVNVSENTAGSGGGLLLGASGGGVDYVLTDGTLVALNVADDGAGVRIDGGSGHAVALTGGEVRYNDGRWGGGVGVTGEGPVDVTLTGVDLHDNGADQGAGGLGITAAGNVTLADLVIHDNASIIGGGLAVTAADAPEGEVDWPPLTLVGVGASVAANTATSGGGVSLEPESGVGIVLVGLEITGNRAEVAGGLVVRDALGEAGSVPITLDAVALRENEATNLGGGAYLSVSGPFVATGVVVEGNQAGVYGGGVFLGSRAGEAVFSGEVSVRGNEAPVGAGAVLACPLDLDATLTLDGWSITENHADTSAGGLLVAAYDGSVGACDASATDLTLTDNTSDGDGGGLTVALPGTLTLVGGVVTGNGAVGRGGGAAVTAGVLTVEAGDWGEGETENTPDDVAIPDASVTGYGAAATFTCDLAACDPATP